MLTLFKPRANKVFFGKLGNTAITYNSALNIYQGHLPDMLRDMLSNFHQIKPENGVDTHLDEKKSIINKSFLTSLGFPDTIRENSKLFLLTSLGVYVNKTAKFTKPGQTQANNGNLVVIYKAFDKAYPTQNKSGKIVNEFDKIQFNFHLTLHDKENSEDIQSPYRQRLKRSIKLIHSDFGKLQELLNIDYASALAMQSSAKPKP